MLKLGTVFSGIGSVEHALERLNVPYELKFACDNGDINILSEDIDDNITALKEEIDILVKIAENIGDRDLLLFDLKNTDETLNIVLKDLYIDSFQTTELLNALSRYEKSEDITNNQKKDYSLIKNKHEEHNNEYDVVYE